MGRWHRIALVPTTFVLVGVLGAGLASACALDGWLTIAPADPGATSLTLTGGDFPPGEVLIRSGSTQGPVVGEAVAGADGRFVAEVALPQQATPSLKILAEPVEQLEAGSRVLGWTFVGDAVAPPAPSTSALPALVAAGVVLLLLGLAVGIGGRARRTDAGDTEPVAGERVLVPELAARSEGGTLDAAARPDSVAPAPEREPLEV
jgi:hypothetical protein